MSDGQALEQGYDEGKRPTTAQANEWATRVENYLRTHLDERFVVRRDRPSDNGLTRAVGRHGSGRTRISYPLLANAPTPLELWCPATHEPNLNAKRRTAGRLSESSPTEIVGVPGG